VLDIGCGDGTIGNLITKLSPIYLSKVFENTK
jgi:16S rRNA G1207 methylase RsmC